jgi:hypothetical protein
VPDQAREDRRESRGSGSPRVTNLSGEAYWSGGSSTRKFAQPGSALEELEEGKRGGHRGLYRGPKLGGGGRVFVGN